MKRIIALVMGAVMMLTCASCANPEQSVPDVKPQLSQMKAICELAVMECYYHNVAKFLEEDASGFWLWKKDKHFWIEYHGVVELGIDVSLVHMEIDENTVIITMPEAEVLGCTVDSSSLSEDSFIIDQDSAKISAEDEIIAFERAQSEMEESASKDKVLLSSAQQRAQTLLENYVNNIGKAVGKEYLIKWDILSENGKQAEASVSSDITESEAR